MKLPLLLTMRRLSELQKSETGYAFIIYEISTSRGLIDWETERVLSSPKEEQGVVCLHTSGDA